MKKKSIALMLCLIVSMLMLSTIFWTVGVAKAESSSTTWTVEVGGGAPLPPIPGVIPGVNSTGSVEYLTYSSSVIVIEVGDTVNWTMASTAMAPHTVTHHLATGEPLFDSSPWVNETSIAAVMPAFATDLMPGQTFSYNFNTPGNYTIRCKVHPFMIGVINVTTTQAPENTIVYAKAGTGTPDISVDAFIPYQLVINNGTTVVWTNENPNEAHTVTHLNVTGPRLFDSSPAHPDTEAELFALAPGAAVPGKGFLFPVVPEVPPYHSYAYTFETPGIYHYHCTIHPGMVGTVIVLSEFALGTHVDEHIDELGAEINSLTTIAYAAIGVGVIGILIGAAAAALARRKP